MKPHNRQVSIVPNYFLYGEPPREVDHHFIHLESLDDRSRPNDWNICPHAHSNLSHIFFVSAGAGEMRADNCEFSFDGPAILIVPTRTIHAFSWKPGTAGRVLTVSDSYLGELLGREHLFGDLFITPDRLALRHFPEGRTRITECLELLTCELAQKAPAHRIAIEAHLLSLLVVVFRIARRGYRSVASSAGRHAQLVARFREAVDYGFRTSRGIDTYATLLGVSVPQLRVACQKVAHQSPLRILRGRALLEAKRMLLYSNMTIAEAGYSLGFDDPAYFSRVFHQHVGISPREFRAQNTIIAPQQI